MSSFPMAVIERPSHLIEEETIDISGLARDSEPGNVDTAYELHPLPSYRARRPSAVRVRSDATMTFKDAMSEPATLGVDDGKSIYTAPTLARVQPMVTIPNIHVPRKQRRYSMIHFATLCWCFFMQGWNDGATGPLLPKMQEYYHTNFSIVSMLFVFGCVGYLIGAGMNVWLNDRLGFGKTVVLGSIFPLVAYAISSPAPPFPVMVFGYFLCGFGNALQFAQGNGFVASMHQTTKLSLVLATYGVGAFTSPLVATHFAGTRHWSYHFLISTGIAVSNTAVLCLVFRFRRQEDILAEAGQHPVEGESANGQNIYRAIFRIKSVHFLAIFALVYIGVEITLGGWIVTFIISERGGGPSAGYISSGFFGGRSYRWPLALVWFSKKVGEHRVVFLYAVLIIALELTVWFVPSIIENAIAVSFIGMLLGPMYPILVDHASRILPAWLLTGSVGWITGVGVSGSAVLPLVTGVLASKFGIRSLQPFVVSMMCTMLGVWALIPRAPRRVE
ncbi:MFS general substrate transporter [Hymenopellis radicata]|nr:MFS general substrate transporter [Hymenopellis radicata]